MKETELCSALQSLRSRKLTTSRFEFYLRVSGFSVFFVLVNLARDFFFLLNLGEMAIRLVKS